MLLELRKHFRQSKTETLGGTRAVANQLYRQHLIDLKVMYDVGLQQDYRNFCVAEQASPE